MRSRREVLRIAGATVLLSALAACSKLSVRLEWVERWFRDHPAVATVDLGFREPDFFWQAPALNFGSVELKPNLPADQVVAFNRYVTELVHRESPHLSGNLAIRDPGYVGGHPRSSGSFTFPDFEEFPSVEVTEAATRHWLDLNSKYASVDVHLSWDENRSDTVRVSTNLSIDERDVPAALATVFDDFGRHGLPSSVTTSWRVATVDPTVDHRDPNAILPSSYGSDGLPPVLAVRAMQSLATLNRRLSQDERATIYTLWWPDDRRRYFLAVRINLHPRELRSLRSSDVDDAIPDSSAPRMADTFLEQIDKAGIPYKLMVNVFHGRPFLTLDRTST